MTCLAFGTSTATLLFLNQSEQRIQICRTIRLAMRVACSLCHDSAWHSCLSLSKAHIALILPPDFKGNELKDLVIATALPSLKSVALFLSPTAAAGLVLTQALYRGG